MNDKAREAAQATFEAWCPYKGSPDPSTVWHEAFRAALQWAASQQAEMEVTITAPGMVKVGDKIRFTLSGKRETKTVALVLNAGTDKEELIYNNKRRSYYIITSMAMAGTGSQKNVCVLRSGAASQQAETVKLPTGEDEAAAMVSVGIAWLTQHAPHRLKTSSQQAAPDWSQIARLMDAVNSAASAKYLIGTSNWAAHVCRSMAAAPAQQAAEGGTQKDAEVLRQANHGFAEENQRLRQALRFYAAREHFNLSDQTAWDTVSGEPQNWWCDEAGTATVEDGHLASMALRGEVIDWGEDGLPPVCQGEPEDLITAAAPTVQGERDA